MKIHHLSCGTLCPIGGSLIDGYSRGLTGKLVCHTLAIETEASGLVLVDTGFGVEDMRTRGRNISGVMKKLFHPQFNENQTALRQIEEMGFKREDVRHILLTHLDVDHSGGIKDFPEATVHLLADELEYAKTSRSFKNRHRHGLTSAQLQFTKWQTYREDGTRWYGFNAVQNLVGLPPEFLMIPLRGHSCGHAGIAINDSDRWLFHAGDAYFYRGEMDPTGYTCTPGLSLMQNLMETDRQARITNQWLLRKLVKRYSPEIDMFSSHDAIELQFHLEIERENFIGLHADAKFPNLLQARVLGEAPRG